jgi:hypothetical protein
VADIQPPENTFALSFEHHYLDLDREEDKPDHWFDKFYHYYPIGVSNPIRVYYGVRSVCVDILAEVHYCLNLEDSLDQGGAVVLETIESTIPDTTRIGTPRREAIKQALYSQIQERKWFRIRGFNFRCADRDFPLGAIVDTRPWPKPASLFTQEGLPLQVEPAAEKKIQLDFNNKVVCYIGHRLTDYLQAIKLDGEEHHEGHPFWIDLWSEHLLTCCEGTQVDLHPRAAGVREWELKRELQERAHQERIAELNRASSSEGEESGGEDSE